MNGEGFDREAAERIIRRAVELDDATTPDDSGLVTEAALAEAAEEIGIDVAAVRQAMAEERLGLAPQRPTLADRWVGPSRLVAAYPFPDDAQTALARIDAWLCNVAGFRRVHTQARGGEYRRRSDMLASLQRASRKMTGKELLAANVDRLTVLVEPLADGTSLVAFTVDKDIEQNLTMAGSGVLAAGGTITSVALAVQQAELFAIGVPVALAAGWGAGAIRKLSLRESQVNLSSVLATIAEEPVRASAAGATAANAATAVKGFASLVNDGVAARRGAKARRASAQSADRARQDFESWRSKGTGSTGQQSQPPTPGGATQSR